MKKDTQQPVMILTFLLFLMIAFMLGLFYNNRSDNRFVNEGVDSNEYEEVSLEGPQASPETIFEITDTDVVRGDSSILLIEYSDLDCPFCQRFHLVAQSLVDSGEIKWVYRHWPLPSHKNADEAAAISECVRENKGDDSFVKYIDESFSSRKSSVDEYKELGISFGLTENQIESCIAEGSKERQTVLRHFNEGAQVGVNGTPGSFLINTKNNRYVFLPGALPVEQVRSAIERIK